MSDFPAEVVEALGLEVLTPDALLVCLIEEFQAQMLAVHGTTVASLAGATDESTIAALRKAGASGAAEAMTGLLGVDGGPTPDVPGE